MTKIPLRFSCSKDRMDGSPPRCNGTEPVIILGILETTTLTRPNTKKYLVVKKYDVAKTFAWCPWCWDFGVRKFRSETVRQTYWVYCECDTRFQSNCAANVSVCIHKIKSVVRSNCSEFIYIAVGSCLNLWHDPQPLGIRPIVAEASTSWLTLGRLDWLLENSEDSQTFLR